MSAFAEHASGLLVPDEISREREVWTKDEARLIERATKLLESRDIQVFFGCPHPRCQDAPIRRYLKTDGAMSLRCGHKDRLFTRAF